MEATLVEHARTQNPDQLAVLTRTVRVCLDPAGILTAERDHDRHRHATLTLLPDGSGRLQACLTGQATAVWQTILSTLARPAPDGDGGEPDLAAPGNAGTTRCSTPGNGCCGPARCPMPAAPPPPSFSR